jgi:O-antigen biosynthesis protein
MVDHGRTRLKEFLKTRDGYYDLWFVSRPHNMERLNSILSKKAAPARPAIVYDAEALYCLRTIKQLELSGKAPSPKSVRESIDKEVKIAAGCASVIAVSERESRYFRDHGIAKVYILSHALEPSPTPNPFELRGNLLFVGGIHSADTPNADSILWFVTEILPRIREKSRQDLKLVVVGSVDSPEILKLSGDEVEFTGKVDDLTSMYSRSRLFIAPTRFAAGVPLKVYEAAAHGLPVVATGMLADQLGWRDGDELLVADSAESFAAQCLRLYQDRALWNRLRSNALDRVRKDCSLEGFSASLRRIREEAIGQSS